MSELADVVVIGEAFVDFLPKGTGKLSHIDGFEMHCGGAPCNVVRGISKLGVSARFISVLGDDEFSDFVYAQLEKSGVQTQGIRRLPSGRMQLCFVTLDDSGDRQFTGRGPDASLSIGVQDMRPELFEGSKSLVLTCGALRTRQGVFAIERALQQAKGQIFCDPGTCPPEWCDPTLMRRRLWGVFTRCDVVKCAEHETYWLTEQDDPLKAAMRFIQEGVKLAIVTLGAKGALWARRNQNGQITQGTIPAPPVSVVDTTGAGDAFFSALVSRLTIHESSVEALSDDELNSVLMFSTHIGSLAVTRKGAVHGIPELSRPELSGLSERSRN